MSESGVQPIGRILRHAGVVVGSLRTAIRNYLTGRTGSANDSDQHPDQALFLVNEAGAVFEGDEWTTVRHWGADDLEDLADFPVVIAEVPDEEDILERHAGDIIQAQAAAVVLVWLHTVARRHSLAKLLGSPVYGRRHPVMPPSALILDTPFKEYLALTPCEVTIRTPHGTTALSRVTEGDLCTALLDERAHPHITVVLPGPARVSAAAASMIIDAARRLRVEASPLRRLRADVRRGLVTMGALVVLFAASSCGLHTKTLRLDDWLDRDPASSILRSDEDDDPVNDQFEQAETIANALEGDTSEIGDLSEAIRIAAYFGARERVTQLVRAARSGSECYRDGEAVDGLWRAGRFAARRGAYEDAIVLLQEYVTYVYDDEFCQLSTEQGPELSAAQHFLRLMTANYVAHDAAVVGQLVEIILNLDDAPAPAAVVDPSLEDNLEYVAIAQRTRKAFERPFNGVLVDDARERWSGFVRRYPDSDRADAALFNLLVLRTAAFAPGTPASQVIKAKRDFLTAVNAFVSRYQRSYLTDDALLLGARIAASIDEDETAKRFIQRLATSYRRTDSLVSLVSRLTDVLERRLQCEASACDDIARDLLRAVATDETARAASVLANSSAGAAAGLRQLGFRSELAARAQGLDVILSLLRPAHVNGN